MPSFKSDESVFNMAMAYLKRIDQILYKAQEAATTGDIDEWLNQLYAIRREVSVKLKSEEEEELRKKFSELVKFLTPINKIKQRGKIRTMLDEIDIFIRKKLQERGMLLPSKSDPRFAILER